jgi:hypothetical protein
MLGNDRETSNYTTATAKWWLRKQAYLHGKGFVTRNNEVFGKRCSLRGPCR